MHSPKFSSTELENTTAARRFVEMMHKTQFIREAAQASERALAHEITPEIFRIVLREWMNRIRSGNWADRSCCASGVLPLLLLLLRCRLRLARRLTSIELYFVEYYLANAGEVIA